MTTATQATQTGSLDAEIAQIEQELSALRKELKDLDERGVYRVELQNGQVLEAHITGDELRFDNETLLREMGLQTAGRQPAEGTAADDSPAGLKRYLPYALIGGGVIVIIFALAVGLGAMVRNGAQGQTPGTPTPSSTPAPTPTITPSPAPTPTPTPALIPDDFIARVPATLWFPALNLTWPIAKGEWRVEENRVLLSEEGNRVRYYDSFVGTGNTVIGGSGATPDDPLYSLRSADINDVLGVVDRAERTFYFRLLPFGGNRVERWITPGDTWVIEDTDFPALTIIIRVNEKRMVLRGELFYVEGIED